VFIVGVRRGYLPVITETDALYLPTNLTETSPKLGVKTRKGTLWIVLLISQTVKVVRMP
jgi:hypothetical protein